MIAEKLSQQSEWQRERAMLLHDICQHIKDRMNAGMTKKAAMQQACKQYSGALLTNGNINTKTLKLGERTLERNLKKWTELGETPAAFDMNFHPGKQKIPQELIDEFHRVCSLPGVVRSSVAISDLRKRWRNNEDVPGLGTWMQWWTENHPGLELPPHAPEFPFTERSLYRRAPKKSIRALGNHGIAAFKRESVHIDRTRAKLRPCELFILDDKRPDLVIIDDETGRVSDVMIYLMQEGCSTRIAGYTVRPAKAMNSSDVDALVARVLLSEGIGRDYATHIYFERGTVGISPAAKQTIEHATEGRVKIHRTSVDSGRRAPLFAKDKPSGHWQGKAPIESFMGYLDNLLMLLPGQRGNKYENQPANLAYSQRTRKAGKDNSVTVRETRGGEAGEAEALASIELACGRKLGLDTGLLWLTQFNLVLREIIKEYNSSRGHDFEGFGYVTQKMIAPDVWEDAI